MRAVAIALLCASAACVQSNLVECGDLVCPASTVCAPARDRCVAADQVASCNGHADNDPCEYLGLAGACHAGLCEPSGSEPFTLHVSLPGPGGGRVVSDPAGIDCGATCSAMFPRGTQVVLTASPLAASTFTGWSGPCSGTGTCQLTVTAEATVAALFILPPAPTITDVTPERGNGVGGDVVILGTDLTGASAVTFGGVTEPAFTVVSPTRIETTVPAGARTGAVTVTTPGGMATWNAFTVILADIESVSGLDGTVAGCADVGFVVSQADAFPANVRIEVDPGTGTFQPATPVAGSASLLGVATSPQGKAYTFHWDSTHDVPHATVTSVNVRVSATVANAAGSAGRAVTKTLSVRNGPDFAPAVHYDADARFDAWALGDVNGDGRLDVVVHAAQGVHALVLLGDGRGGFQAPIDVPLDVDFFDVTIADVNGDGRADLLAGGASNLWVALGNGDGTFGPARSAGVDAIFAQPIDLDHDGKLDLIVRDFVGNWATAFGNGDGTFRPGASLPIFGTPAIGDLNGDGSVDLVNSGDNLYSWLGSPGGAFGDRITTQVFGAYVGAFVLTDLDGDGKLDIAGDGGVVRLGKGNGTFGAETRIPSLSGSAIGAVADVNADGKRDIVALTAQRPAVLIAGADGKSEGTFVLPENVQPPMALAIADLDGDGRPDLLVRHNAGIEVLMNQTVRSCEIAFEEAQPASVGCGPDGIIVADLNGDGRLDLAVACSDQVKVSILLGNGDGSFEAAMEVPASSLPLEVTSNQMSLAAGDLDRDGKIDLVVSSSNTGPQAAPYGSVAVLYGRGDGTFTAPVDYLPFEFPTSVSIGDIDGDGRLDLFAASNPFAALAYGDGDRSFRPFADLGTWVGSATLTDLNGDGKADVVAFTFPGAVYAFLGTPAGPATPVYFSTDVYESLLAVADVTGDGNPDIIVERDLAPYEIIFWSSNRDGTVGSHTTAIAPSHAGSAVVADFDGDGRPDLAVALEPFSGEPSATFAIFYGTGGGNFASPVLYAPPGPGGGPFAVGDLDGDGRPDLIFGDFNAGEIRVFLSR